MNDTLSSPDSFPQIREAIERAEQLPPEEAIPLLEQTQRRLHEVLNQPASGSARQPE